MPTRKNVTSVEETAQPEAFAQKKYVADQDFEQPWKILFHKDTKHPDQVTGSQGFSLSVTAGEVFELPEGWARDVNYEVNTLTKNSERKGIPFLTPSGARVILPVKEA